MEFVPTRSFLCDVVIHKGAIVFCHLLSYFEYFALCILGSIDSRCKLMTNQCIAIMTSLVLSGILAHRVSLYLYGWDFEGSAALRRLHNIIITIDLAILSEKIYCLSLGWATTLDLFLESRPSEFTPNVKPHRAWLWTAHWKRVFVKQRYVYFMAARLPYPSLFIYFILCSNESIFHCGLRLISSAFFHLLFSSFFPPCMSSVGVLVEIEWPHWWGPFFSFFFFPWRCERLVRQGLFWQIRETFYVSFFLFLNGGHQGSCWRCESPRQLHGSAANPALKESDTAAAAFPSSVSASSPGLHMITTHTHTHTHTSHER